VRKGRATRGKWRVLDEKVRERSVVMFKAPKVVAPPVSIKDRSSGPSEQVQLCTGTCGIYGIPQT
jgi:hypothetical protein